MKTKQYFLTIALILITSIIHSQTPQFQWTKAGGSQGSATNSGLMESCKWLSTDAHGNIYGMSSIFDYGIKIDTSIKSTGFGNDDFGVFSYRCDGSLRWVRYFGNSYNDYPVGMFTDNNGNSFFAGIVAGNQYAPLYHYGDSSITQQGITPISPFIVAKLDSNGHTAWISFGPSAPNVAYNFVSVQPDNQGNICVLTQFYSAAIWGAYTIPGKGYYVLKFDKSNGILLGFTKLDYNESSGHSYNNINFAIDSDNNYYFTDILNYPDTLIVGSYSIIHNNDSIFTTVLIKFFTTGNLSWYKIVNGNFLAGYKDQFINGLPLILGNYVYIFGAAQNNVNFFGNVINNTNVFAPYIYSPFVARFKKDNGNFVSLKHIYNRVLTTFDALAVTSSGIVVTGTTGAGSSGHEIMMYNQTDTLKPGSTFNTAYPFILGIDTALNHFNWGMATRVNNADSKIEALTVDLADNIYAGGKISDSIYNSFGQGIRSQGGPSDFFIAKIATQNNCGCIKSQPYPQLVGISNKTVTVKGTATGIADSLYWVWGDGTKTIYTNQNTNITHTYTTGGNYTVCLHTSNYCGTKDSCIAVNGVGINEQQLNYLNAYPNPVTNTLTIENPYQCSMQLRIYSITGKLLFSNKYENYTSSIDMSIYEKGIYFIEIILADGRKAVRKIVRN
jgi:hypothetical protein